LSNHGKFFNRVDRSRVRRGAMSTPVAQKTQSVVLRYSLPMPGCPVKENNSCRIWENLTKS
jgi:hypothetical protein